jgi:bacteriocin-like protein
MEMINENNLSISEFQDQSQFVELDDNELDNVTGGAVGALAAWGTGYLDGKRGGRLLADMAIWGVAGLAGGGLLGAALSTPKE